MNRWLNTTLIIAVAVYMIDINTVWYRHPANVIPALRYTIIGMSAICFLLLVRIITGKSKKKK
ncbi:MAG: hypothetical protein J0I41_13525 [Filimonas sp.]|nr:hypothetical protein [Filimonas sp.]